MASIIRIKRSTGFNKPGSLKTAEMAYAYGVGTATNDGDRLFIGTGDDGTGNATNVTIIGGSYFTDMLDHLPGLLRTNSAIIADSEKKVEELKSGNIHIDGFNDQILGLVAPTDSSGATTKKYVDSAITALDASISLNIQAAVQDSTGVVGGTYGGATSIPIIKVNDFGRVDSVGTSPLSTTLMVSADSGTADSVDLINDTLNFSGSNSIITKVTDGNIDIRLDSARPGQHLAVKGALYPGLYTFGGGSSNAEVSVDDFGIVKTIRSTNILAEITLRDDPSGSGETLYTSQNDLVVTGGPGVTVNLTKNAYNGPATFEIAIDSGGTIAADSATFTKLKVDVGANHGGTSTNNRIELFGDIKLGDDINNHQLDLSDVRITSNLIPQSVNVSHMGEWGNPFASLSLGSGLNFAGTTGQDHIYMRSNRDSALTISTVQSSGIYPTATGDMVTYRTTNGDSAVVNHVDVVIDNDKNLVLGNGYDWNGNTVPGKTTLRHDTTDHWFEMLADSHTTSMEIAAKGITLIAYDPAYDFRSGQGAITGTGYIQLDANVIPAIGRGMNVYNQGHRRNLGLSGRRFGTIYADHFDRPQVVDSGVYGSAAGIPVITVNKSGLIDSVGIVDVAGVDSASWGSASTTRPFHAVLGDNLLTITTGDGTAHEVDISQWTDSVQFGNNVRFSHQPNHKVIVPHHTKLSFQDHSHTGITGDPEAATMFRNSGTSGEFEFYNNGDIKIRSSSNNKGVYFPSKVEFDGSVQLDDSVTFNEVVRFGAFKPVTLPNNTNLYLGDSVGMTAAIVRSTATDQLAIQNNGEGVHVVGRRIDLSTLPTVSGTTPKGMVRVAGDLIPRQHPSYSPNENWDIGEDSDYTWNNAYFMGTVKAGDIELRSGGNVVADSGTFAKLLINDLTVDNINIDGNTIKSTDSSNQIFIDPAPTDSDGGDLIIRGNLIVRGTETIVNSSVVSLNDKNLVLADSAANSSVADGAGITVGGAGYTGTKPQFIFDAATDRWDPNLPIDIPFVSLDSAVFLNGVALREVMEDHLDNFFGVDSNNAVTITYDDTANSMTWKAVDATKTQKGVSTFDSSNFAVVAGNVTVTVLDGGTY